MLKVFDRANIQFTSPKHIFNRYIDLRVSTVLGGEQTLEFSIPFPEVPVSLQTEDFVEFDNKKFIIKRFTTSRTESGKLLRIECNGLYELLIDTVISGEDTWLAGVTMRIALERALRGTLFTVGTCEDFGTWDIELGELNALEAINNIRNSWPGTAEIYFDGFTLNAVAMRGSDTNVQIAYRKNLGTIEKLEDSSDLVTRLKGRGKDGMTIEGLDVTAETELTGFSWELQGGKKIITKDYVDSTTINNYAIPKEAIKEWTEIESQKQLFDKMKEYILQVYKPKISYVVSFVELSRQGINFADVNIGDWVYVNDVELGINEKVRVVELDKNPMILEQSTATLATRQSTMIDFLADLKDTKSLVTEMQKGLTGKFAELELAIENATKIINAGNSTVIISETDGIYVIDSETLGPNGAIINTTKLIHMANGAIGCSVDGGTTYRNALTGEGINADAITAGKVSAQYVTVGSLTGFEDGFSPDDIKNPVYIEMQNTKDSVNQRADVNDSSISVLNTSVQQTNTAMTMLDVNLKNKVDILNQDVSGLNGDVASLNSMYAGLNSLVRTDSYFFWDTSGLHAVEKLNTKNKMLLTSTGLALSTNGGVTYNNAITARGIVASQVNIGVFGEAPFKGLTLHNGQGAETFVVDTNGNVSLTGNINMVGGSIAWNAVSKMPYDAIDNSFKNKFTYIDSNGVYTKEIKADQIDVKGLTVSDASNDTTFSVSSSGDVSIYGTIHMKAGSTIEWDSIVPPSAEQIGAATQTEVNSLKTDLEQRTTRITADGIYTGQIDAQQITIGKIKIGQIDTSSITPNAIGAATLTQYNTLINTVNQNQQSLSAQITANNSNVSNLLNSFQSDLSYLYSRYVDKDNVTPLVTTITNNAIQTSYFSADRIVGGTLTGVTINGAVIYADDKMYIGNRGQSITNTGSRKRRLVFDDYNVPADISYEQRADGYYHLVLKSDQKMLFWGLRGLRYHNNPRDIKFAKFGLSSDGAASQYFSMQDIIDALKRLGEDITR